MYRVPFVSDKCFCVIICIFQEFMSAQYIRLRLQRILTLFGDRMVLPDENDSSVYRRVCCYFSFHFVVYVQQDMIFILHVHVVSKKPYECIHVCVTRAEHVSLFFSIFIPSKTFLLEGDAFVTTTPLIVRGSKRYVRYRL